MPEKQKINESVLISKQTKKNNEILENKDDEIEIFYHMLWNRPIELGPRQTEQLQI